MKRYIKSAVSNPLDGDLDVEDLWEIAQTTIDEDVIETLANHESYFVRQFVAQNENTPDYILQKLADDEEAIVRVWVALYTKDIDTIIKLSKDPSFHVRENLAGNWNTPISIIRKLFPILSPTYRGFLVNRPDIPNDLLFEIFKTPNLKPYYREEVNRIVKWRGLI